MDALEGIWGDDEGRIRERLESLDPDLAAYIEGFAYREVLSRDGLDLKTRELLAITSLVALGSPPEIATHFRGALKNGATEAEIKETLLQAALFFGFPRAIAAFERWRKFRKKQDGALEDTE